MIFSVIIPTFNESERIRNCLDSVLSQQLCPEDRLDIVCIDDCSTDGTFVILEEYAQKGLITAKRLDRNMGVSAARNAGLDICVGDIVLFLDADDHFHDDIFKRISLLENEHNPDVLVMRSVESESGRDCYPKRLETGKLFTKEELSKCEFERFSVCGIAFNREFLGERRFCQGIRNGEDTIYFAECLINVRSLLFDEAICYIVSRRQGSASSSYPLERLISSEEWIRIASNLLTRQNGDTDRMIAGRHLYQAKINCLLTAKRIGKVPYSRINDTFKNSAKIPYNCFGNFKKRLLVFMLNTCPVILFRYIMRSK